MTEITTIAQLRRAVRKAKRALLDALAEQSPSMDTVRVGIPIANVYGDELLIG